MRWDVVGRECSRPKRASRWFADRKTTWKGWHFRIFSLLVLLISGNGRISNAANEDKDVSWDPIDLWSFNRHREVERSKIKDQTFRSGPDHCLFTRSAWESLLMRRLRESFMRGPWKCCRGVFSFVYLALFPFLVQFFGTSSFFGPPLLEEYSLLITLTPYHRDLSVFILFGDKKVNQRRACRQSSSSSSSLSSNSPPGCRKNGVVQPPRFMMMNQMRRWDGWP